MVEVSLTVGKLDASLALLLTKDHHLIEFPTILLPDGVQAGSIVKIKCDRDLQLEEVEKEQFSKVQDEILQTFGKSEPKAPVLKLRNVTQTSCVLEWEPLELSTASIKSLTLFKNGKRLGQIPNPLINTTTKLSGLPIDTPFKFNLKLDTTAGVYESAEIEVRTHKMTDLSGITVCLGEIDWREEGFERSDIETILHNIGAKPLQDEVKVDTTHFICTLAKGQQWKLAVDNNIPIVRPEWLKACANDKRIVGVRTFYLDSTGDAIAQHKIVHGEKKFEGEVKQESKVVKPVSDAKREDFDDVPLNESSSEVKEVKTDSDERLKETAEKLEKITQEVEKEKVKEESEKEIEKTEGAVKAPEEVKGEVKEEEPNEEEVEEEPKEEVEEEVKEKTKAELEFKEQVKEEPKEEEEEEEEVKEEVKEDVKEEPKDELKEKVKEAKEESTVQFGESPEETVQNEPKEELTEKAEEALENAETEKKEIAQETNSPEK